MVRALLSQRRFAPLFWSQFCSALNDNFLKNALTALILFGIATNTDALYSDGTKTLLVTLSGVVFIAPFFFLSALGGEIADKYDKARVAERIKFFEIPVALLAAVGFYLTSVPLLFVALFGFGVIGALFGPVKYGLLPERLTTDELSTGNALVEGATFLAILLGTILGGIAVTEAGSPLLILGVVLVLAVICWLSARMIPAYGPADPTLVITRNPLQSTFALLTESRKDARITQGAHITSWFWLVGIVSLALLPQLVTKHLGGSSGSYTLALSVFTIGIAVGSMVAAGRSHGTPNLSIVTIGGYLMAAAGFALATCGLNEVGIAVPRLGPLAFIQSIPGLALLTALFALAVAGGLFIVPSFAAVQTWAPPDRRARVIASINVLNAAYMTGGGATLALLQGIGLGPATIFALIGLGSLVVTVWLVSPWATTNKFQ